MLQSQDGVENVEDPYGNLKQGLIKIKTKRDKRIDLARLVHVLEKEAGFEPVTEVTLELRGRLARREGKLYFEASETGQTFEVRQVSGAVERPPENELLEVVAILADARSNDQITLPHWKAVPAAGGNAGAAPASSAPTATAELVVSGMT